jgi:hypothetical protein
MTTRTLKTELTQGYEIVRVIEGTFEKGYTSADLKSLQTVFVPKKIKEKYVRCPVTGLHLATIGEHKTLRSYAATAIKAIGVTYDNQDPYFEETLENLQGDILPMVIIQNKEYKWFALRVIDNHLQVKELQNFEPYADIGDDWNNQPFDNIKIWGWRYLTVNQSQSTNKRLLSITDWFLRR